MLGSLADKAAAIFPADRENLEIVVGFSPGGPSDVLARTIGKQMCAVLGMELEIVSRPGDGGSLAAQFAARATPDGCTLLLANNSILATNEAVDPRLAYNAAADFTPVGLIGSQPNILVVNPGLGVTTVPDLIALLQQRAGQLSFSSTGHGAAAHLTAEQFMAAARVDLRHIVHEGAPTAVTDVVTGKAALMFATVASVAEPITASLLRPLAVTTRNRIGLFPDLPTLRELGFQTSGTMTWHGLVAPAGTPDSVITVLNEALAVSLASTREGLTALGIEIGGGSPRDFAEYIEDQRTEWRDLVQTSGARFRR